jgi:hypothetical protein
MLFLFSINRRHIEWLEVVCDQEHHKFPVKMCYNFLQSLSKLSRNNQKCKFSSFLFVFFISLEESECLEISIFIRFLQKFSSIFFLNFFLLQNNNETKILDFNWPPFSLVFITVCLLWFMDLFSIQFLTSSRRDFYQSNNLSFGSFFYGISAASVFKYFLEF